MNQIIHQTQPTWNSCVSTCLAMLAGIPAEEVIAKYHDRYMKDSGGGEISILEELGIVAVPSSTICRTLWHGQVYLVCAASINIEQGSHQIIIDTREDCMKLYDPNMGCEGKKYYVPYGTLPENCNEFEVPLTGGWHIDFRILECPALGVIA